MRFKILNIESDRIEQINLSDPLKYKSQVIGLRAAYILHLHTFEIDRFIGIRSLP